MLGGHNVDFDIKKFSIQRLGFDRSVCMAAIPAVPTNEPFLREKKRVQTFGSISQKFKY